MSENFNIYLRRNFEVENTVNFFNNVYKEYKGNLFLPESVRMKGKEIVIHGLDFNPLSKYINRDISTLPLKFKKTLSPYINDDILAKYPDYNFTIWPTLYINFKYFNPDFNRIVDEEHPRIHFGLSFNIFFNKDELYEMINFAIALMEAQGESLFVGGREIASFEYAEPWIWVIGYKEKNKLIDYLKNHIKYHFKLELTTNKIEKILQKTAKVEKINGVNILFLADLDRWKKDPDNYKIEFYQELKKLKK